MLQVSRILWQLGIHWQGSVRKAGLKGRLPTPGPFTKNALVPAMLQRHAMLHKYIRRKGYPAQQREPCMTVSSTAVRYDQSDLFHTCVI